MKKIIIGFLIFLFGAFVSLIIFQTNIFQNNQAGLSSLNLPRKIENPLDKYTIENLSTTDIEPGEINILEVIDNNSEYISRLTSFEFKPDPENSESKKTTGQLNIPQGTGPFPLVVMLRGYIDQELHETGDGTRKAAEVFANNGFITLAPDFLGYGNSDKEAANIFETRFQTYVTVLSLLKSLDQVQSWDGNNIFIWGHSNGGQIALTILEITGEKYPTTLWAPVSKPFPYSILFYTDVSNDRGKLIRRELSKFEANYNPDKYSLDLYLDKIKAPLQIHQGTADDSVPISWSNELVENLSELSLNLDYFKYPGANHNMVPSWNAVVSRDVDFFNKHLD